MPFSQMEEVIEDIRAGKMVIVCDDEDRENEGDLTMAAELVTSEDINFMAVHGRGLICLPMAEALQFSVSGVEKVGEDVAVTLYPDREEDRVHRAG